MRCQNELIYVAQIIRDFATTLPPSAKIAMEEKAQGAINAIEHDLSQALLPVEPPAAKQPEE